MEKKSCRACNTSFEVTDADIAFYENISPTFGAKKYALPTPTLCPECRQQRRQAFRNEMRLYKRTCDLTGKSIVSVHSPDKPYPVYDRLAWEGGSWNPLDYGVDFDFSRPFFEQFHELFCRVPQFSLLNTGSENSDYCNNSIYERNCYLIFVSGSDEDCFYSYVIGDSKDSCDILWGIDCHHCYECVDVIGCYDCQHCRTIRGSSRCYSVWDSADSHDCSYCIGLSNKKYCLLNRQETPESYAALRARLRSDRAFRAETEAAFERLTGGFPRRALRRTLSEGVTGDNIVTSKNCHACYDISDGHDCAYIYDGYNCNSVYDNTTSGSVVPGTNHERSIE